MAHAIMDTLDHLKGLAHKMVPLVNGDPLLTLVLKYFAPFRILELKLLLNPLLESKLASVISIFLVRPLAIVLNWDHLVFGYLLTILALVHFFLLSSQTLPQ